MPDNTLLKIAESLDKISKILERIDKREEKRFLQEIKESRNLHIKNKPPEILSEEQIFDKVHTILNS